MTAPYWTDGTVSLYLGDCREVREWLTADVLVTDPPYGRGVGTPQSHTGRAFFGEHKRITGDNDSAARDEALALWAYRTAVVFGDLMLAPPAGNKLTLVYRKPPNAGSFGGFAGWRRDLEAIYLIGHWAVSHGGASSLLTTGARHTNLINGKAHPHAKPVDVMETLIAACPPGVIADPFAGSGSTLVAARNQGRQAIGVEIDERYAEACARRLDQGVLTA